MLGQAGLPGWRQFLLSWPYRARDRESYLTEWPPFQLPTLHVQRKKASQQFHCLFEFSKRLWKLKINNIIPADSPLRSPRSRELVQLYFLFFEGVSGAGGGVVKRGSQSLTTAKQGSQKGKRENSGQRTDWRGCVIRSCRWGRLSHVLFNQSYLGQATYRQDADKSGTWVNSTLHPRPFQLFKEKLAKNWYTFVHSSAS